MISLTCFPEFFSFLFADDFEGLLERMEESGPLSLATGGVGPEENERQRLISAGLLTPFGSSSDEKLVKQNSTANELASTSSHTPSPLSLVDFDWLGVADSARNEHSTTRTTGHLSTAKSARKGKRKAPVPFSLGRDRVTPSLDRECTDSSRMSCLTVHGPSIMKKTLNQSSLEPQSEDEYQAESGEAESSFNLSDEEETMERKRFKLRELLSSEESDGELVHTNWSSGKKRKKSANRKGKSSTDDGNDEMYQLRIRCACVCVCVCVFHLLFFTNNFRQYEASLCADNDPDMEFEGGLIIPGSIWQRLYR